MIIQPKVRGFICTNAHPQGCAANVHEQIDYIKSQPAITGGPKKVLVVGASTGYGLASRITAAFGCGASTLGVFFEKPPTEKRTASAGYYNAAAFEAEAHAAGLYARSINGDAFSDEVKARTIEMIREDLGEVDLVIYSLASPRRTDPKTGQLYSSVLKPIGKPYTSRNLNTDKLEIGDITLEPASEEEIASTVKVMGGEDWELWLRALSDAGVLSDNCKTVAYTYIGDKLTRSVYGDATIGKAKEDLDRAARTISASGEADAHVAVLKALVTQSSSAIPVMPLYISLAYKVMKEEGTHEGCIEQLYRLYTEGLYSDNPQLDSDNRYRMDEWELRRETQAKIEALWPQVNNENLFQLTDHRGYQADFLKLFGFGVDGVDYAADTSPLVPADFA
ncbi:enoyl-ACP reductase FabV [Microbulbifer discodermiae]|uniref:enoyl-ACP reductase FabV n=1 Tax=Microbulbifer sp. 2201CG32-9 TaxID=3232309 RepID=UPI00345B5D66